MPLAAAEKRAGDGQSVKPRLNGVVDRSQHDHEMHEKDASPAIEGIFSTPQSVAGLH